MTNQGTRHLTTDEVVDLLCRQSNARTELALAFVASWVGMLRYVAVRQLQYEPAWLQQVSEGEGKLDLAYDLAPVGLRRLEQPEPCEWISREIGLDPFDTNQLLEMLTGRIRPREEPVDFEPVGTIRQAYAGSVAGTGYVAVLRPDFLRPVPEL